jgi:hypothetical protein
MTREENLKAAIILQELCSDSYFLARMTYKRGYYRLAAFYQKQAARDHKAMTVYLAMTAYLERANK